MYFRKKHHCIFGRTRYQVPGSRYQVPHNRYRYLVLGRPGEAGTGQEESADLLERRACETTFHASFLISVSQPAAASQQQPASCSQPASPASQPSQPANVASGHRSLRPPASRHRCLQTLNKGHPIGPHRLAQVGTGWHRPPQAAKPSGTHSTRGAAKHATNPSNIDDMANFPANHVGGVFRQPD